jgi:hypothetical protein
MQARRSRAATEYRLILKYHDLYETVLEMVAALQQLEPGGTLADDLTAAGADGQSIHVAYTGEPIMLTIRDGERKLVVRVVDENAYVGAAEGTRTPTAP